MAFTYLVSTCATIWSSSEPSAHFFVKMRRPDGASGGMAHAPKTYLIQLLDRPRRKAETQDLSGVARIISSRAFSIRSSRVSCINCCPSHGQKSYQSPDRILNAENTNILIYEVGIRRRSCTET